MRASRRALDYRRSAIRVLFDAAAADPDPDALDLLREQRVSIAPGSVFGPGGEGMVRISPAAAPCTIEAGINRIAAHLQRGSG